MGLEPAVKPGGQAAGQPSGLSYLDGETNFFNSGIDLCGIPGKLDRMTLDSIKKNKWVRRALMVAASIVVLWGLGWTVVPGLVKNQLEKLASEQLGRQVSLGVVHFSPWSLELTLEDLIVAGLPGAPLQLQIKRVYLDAELQSLLRLAPVVDALQLDGLALRLTYQGDGHYDVDDVLARLMAPADPPRPPAGLPRFALYNIAMQSGSIDFVDQSVGRTHEVRELNLSIPFLSSLASRRDVITEPRLAFHLNGSRFDSRAQTTPFAPSHKTDATFQLANLDLRPYLPYLPAGLPVKVLAGVAGADVRLHFEQAPKPAVRLSGAIELKGLQLADAQGQDLLALAALRVDMADVRPLEQIVKLASVELTGPTLDARRDKAGAVNLLNLALPQDGKVSRPQQGGATAQPAAPANAWQLALAKFTVRGGLLRWRDAAVTPAARIDMRDLALDATALALPWRQPASFTGSLALASGTDPNGNKPRAAKAEAATAPAQLSFKGEASEQAATVNAELKDLPLALATPYAVQVIEPALGGNLSAHLALQWKGGQWQVQVPRLEASKLTLGTQSRTDRNWPLFLGRLDVQGVEIKPGERSVKLAKLALHQPAVAVERDREGRWMFERWLSPTMPASTSAADATTRKPKAVRADEAKPSAPAAPWRVAVGDAAVEGGQIRYADRAHGRPVVFDLSALSLQLKDFASDSRQPGPLKLSARMRARRGEPGQLGFTGNLALQPLAVQGRVQAVDLPAHVLSPYLTDVLNLRLQRADAGFKGQVSYAQTARGPVFKLGGDALLEDLLANTVPVAAQTQDLQVGEELLSWKALSLRGLNVALAPGQATRVAVAETALSDFYARIIIHENGRINLQDLVKASEASAPAAEAASTPAAATSTNASASTAGATLAPVIEMGPISLVNGRVLFSDRFIKPNYSADLSELTGRLSAFASVPAGGEAGAAPAMADLELRGRAEGTASLEILGKLNPLAKPLALDITGKMRDLELPPLSPYSVKYAGHGIERGKLAMDVAYKVEPDGQLVARNKLVLNQLTFGDPVEGAPNSLPVRLAVALLADSNGVIDINLPISGSLNDPEFSFGGIIFKMIMNLIAKAITSPFALLASAFDGGDDGELGMVPFAPGSSVLSAEAQANLDKVAKAMKDRPSLTMTVAGMASLEAEREGYKRQRLSALMLAEKRRAAVVAGKPADAVQAVTQAERPELLKAVYRRAQISKPRNLLGFAKDLPPAEMEALLLASIPVGEQQMQELALARGVAVKDYLSSRELPVDRLFLGGVKSQAADAKWVPHAELSLTMK